MIRAAGRFSGKLSYGAIRIELGGLASGELEEITTSKGSSNNATVLVGEQAPTRLQEKISEIERVNPEIRKIQAGVQF